jgi:hypothetical protein
VALRRKQIDQSVVMRCDHRSNQTSIVVLVFPFLVTRTNIKQPHTQV